MPAWELVIKEPVAEFLQGLEDSEYAAVEAAIRVLSEFGPNLTAPSKVKLIVASRHKNMKELRCTSNGKIFRILFAFDPKRRAILLVGGDKSEIGFDDFYEINVPIADAMFDDHCAALAAAEAKESAKKGGQGKGAGKGKNRGKKK